MSVRELIKSSAQIVGIAPNRAAQLSFVFDAAFKGELEDPKSPFSIESNGTTAERFYYFRLLLINEAKDKLKAALICNFVEAIADKDVERINGVLQIAKQVGFAELLAMDSISTAVAKTQEVWN